MIWVSPEDKAVLAQCEAMPAEWDKLVVPCSGGKMELKVGDEFTEKLWNAECTFRVGGFTLDRRCLVRLMKLNGELTPEQAAEYLHVKQEGDLTVWCADSVVARVARSR